MRIIPAIDIIDGKCVRLRQGDYATQKVYSESPLEMARLFEAAGLRYLHLVDLDGARSGKVVNWKTVEELCSKTGLTIDFGGGVKSREDFDRLLDHGVKQVNLGSIAVKDPATVHEWIIRYGADKIILGADVRDDRVAISGWTESSGIAIEEYLTGYTQRGIVSVVCTDISTDGMLGGPNMSLYRRIMEAFPSIRLIASGGVGSMDDVHALRDAGVFGVIIGKAIYEGRVTPAELAGI